MNINSQLFPLRDDTENSTPLGLSVAAGLLHIAVLAPAATQVWWCLFDAHDHEIQRLALSRNDAGIWCGRVTLSELPLGDWHYGFRADGRYAPEQGFFYDPNKLLVDPYAREFDRPFGFEADWFAPRPVSHDTAPVMPKSRFRQAWRDGGIGRVPTLYGLNPERYDSLAPTMIYEVNIKTLTELHPDVPEAVRGTLRALCEPCVLQHLRELGVDAVELMPLVAWVDERHLPRLGLHNVWGYNPIAMMAVEPRLCPNGVEDVQATVAALHSAGIAVIFDVVFNHTGESDEHGATLCLRGLDNRYYYRHREVEGVAELVNDTGCGNTLDTANAGVARWVVDSLHYWVEVCGVDGFRFDLATVLGRDANGFMADAPLLQALAQDEVLAHTWLIAEPWDIGAGGYRLGQFGGRWWEWNDRYRDAVRRFWRGDEGMAAEFATRIAGSSDVFGRDSTTRSINFLAAHDGMALRDVVSFTHKHNEANGENNRDGHDDNCSWNHGVEGSSDDARIEHARRRDVAALLATLLLSRGVPMLTAGDEFGRTQQGNNNAYAQDNVITWLDWVNADDELAHFVGDLMRLRRTSSLLRGRDWLTDADDGTRHSNHESHARWWSESDQMRIEDWQDGRRRQIGLELFDATDAGEHWLIWFNAQFDAITVSLPSITADADWCPMVESAEFWVRSDTDVNRLISDPTPLNISLPPRSVSVWRAMKRMN